VEAGELMEIYNAKMERMDAPDLTKGYLVKSTRKVHHAAIPGVQEVWHYETIAEYSNGGKDVAKVVDVLGVEGKEAWDEYETIQRYILYTEEELAAMEEERKANEGKTAVTWDDLDEAYEKGYHDGYTEGVNSAYDQ
jgi:flagellar biosynthesis/type III secretory pathway protein FliH